VEEDESVTGHLDNQKDVDALSDEAIVEIHVDWTEDLARRQLLAQT